jgi:hypothetical protein
MAHGSDGATALLAKQVQLVCSIILNRLDSIFLILILTSRPQTVTGQALHQEVTSLRICIQPSSACCALCAPAWADACSNIDVSGGGSWLRALTPCGLLQITITL